MTITDVFLNQKRNVYLILKFSWICVENSEFFVTHMSCSYHVILIIHAKDNWRMKNWVWQVPRRHRFNSWHYNHGNICNNSHEDNWVVIILRNSGYDLKIQYFINLMECNADHITLLSWYLLAICKKSDWSCGSPGSSLIDKGKTLTLNKREGQK